MRFLTEHSLGKANARNKPTFRCVLVITLHFSRNNMLAQPPKPSASFYAVIIGILASILFIVIQPMFGIDTITGRHTQAYVSQGNYTVATATIIAWAVHVIVSVFYALASVIIFRINSSFIVSSVQIMVLGWVSTLLATPANVFVITAITTQSLPDLSSIPPLNMALGAKFWLHIIFFVLVVVTLHLVDSRERRKNQSR